MGVGSRAILWSPLVGSSTALWYLDRDRTYPGAKLTAEAEPYDQYRETKHASAKNERAAKVRRDLLAMIRSTKSSAYRHVSLSGYSDKQLRRILSLRLHDECDQEMAQVDYYIKDEVGLRFALQRRNRTAESAGSAS